MNMCDEHLHLVHVDEGGTRRLAQPDAVSGSLRAAGCGQVKPLRRKLGQERSFGAVVRIT